MAYKELAIKKLVPAGYNEEQARSMAPEGTRHIGYTYKSGGTFGMPKVYAVFYPTEPNPNVIGDPLVKPEGYLRGYTKIPIVEKTLNALLNKNNSFRNSWEVSADNIRRQQERASRFRPGAAIAGLAGGISLSALGAGLGGLLGAPAASGVTGVSAGNAASGISSLLGNVSKQALLSGAVKGGLSSAIGGGDIGDILKGAAIGGATSGLTSAVAPSLSSYLGLGGAGQEALSGALKGAATGLASGEGLKGAGIGSALGGLGGYITGGGEIPGLGTMGTQSTVSESGIPIPGVKPTGVLGTLGGAARSISSALGGSSTNGGSMLQSTLGGSGMDLGKALGAGLTYYQSRQAEDEMKDILLRQQDKAKALIAPYINAGQSAQELLSAKLASGELGASFTPEDLTQDPGYQFALEQGQQALDRQQAARGNLYSGAALKAAQTFGQGLADQTYNDAYNRYMQDQSSLYNMLSGQASQGLGAAGAGATLAQQSGDILAASQAAQQQQRNELLAALMGNGLTSMYGGF